MLRTRSLSFAYDSNNAFRFPDLTLEEEAKLLILGESGVGKTTFLHLIAGLLKPQSGKIEFQGTSLHQLSAADLDKFRGKNMGLVFQKPHFVRALSLKENLEMIQYFAGISKDQLRIKRVLESLGLGSKLNMNPYQLSQGEQQRAAIAIAVINQPKLLLADEPTANLDDKNCQKVHDLLVEQATKSKAQLVIITHDQRLKNQFKNTLTL